MEALSQPGRPRIVTPDLDLSKTDHLESGGWLDHEEAARGYVSMIKMEEKRYSLCPVIYTAVRCGIP